jgi:hypothetical protein
MKPDKELSSQHDHEDLTSNQHTAAHRHHGHRSKDFNLVRSELLSNHNIELVQTRHRPKRTNCLCISSTNNKFYCRKSSVRDPLVDYVMLCDCLIMRALSEKQMECSAIVRRPSSLR